MNDQHMKYYRWKPKLIEMRAKTNSVYNIYIFVICFHHLFWISLIAKELNVVMQQLCYCTFFLLTNKSRRFKVKMIPYCSLLDEIPFPINISTLYLTELTKNSMYPENLTTWIWTPCVYRFYCLVNEKIRNKTL